ncbi:glycosyltransferase [Bordetella bronchiseptica]|uniref:glycosyltransferase n=1 Tax=Bordetella bronchiseptica TaxID=518 RepID=UPI00045AEBBC|nr:glycosyltransferase family 4 protein [Bordetella bronchiseptica]KCV61047.1 glycosyltransferases group 1 [Bordetella bronchiseptica 99-R-0433]MBN3269545.1 LPS biosynthesis transferase [Bordetella bronchiseptica]
MAERRPLRILTWHVHGNYLYALTQVPHVFVVPYRDDARPGYQPLGPAIPWGANIRRVPAAQLGDEPLDGVLYQSRQNLEDARMLLSAAQRRLPRAYVEHNPPEPHPTDTWHPFQDEGGTLVHVTHYNAEMWRSPAGQRTCVIEHGLPDPGPLYRGELARGIVVVNHLARRGRRVGADLFEAVRREAPLDLIGMGSQELGGLGEVPNMEVAACMARYRLFFSPVRYASLGLSLVEALLAGVPVVGYAATELPCVIESGRTGYVDTHRGRLAEVVRQLCADPALARQWGEAGRAMARRRFGIERFVRDWLSLWATLTEE